ncbi:MAG: serpin family protein [Solirubrobacteraceae bacterium]
MALIGVAATADASPARQSSAATAARAENAFALSLLPLVGGNGNAVFSPYSVDTALTMAAAGAKGPTAEQLDHVLGASSGAAATADAAGLQSAIGSAAASRSSGGPKLELANALWIQRGVALQRPFVDTLSAVFGAPPQSTDFANAPEPAREAINAWVSQHTAGLIANLLPPGSVTPATVFVLANAIYLKANWATPFDPRLTHLAPFTTTTGRLEEVPFMSADDADYAYSSAADYQAVDLPYRSSSLSLLAILPVGESVARFEATLTAAKLAALVSSLHARSVNLLMPKIHLRTQTALNAPLEALGMTDAFSPSANFSGITARVPLRISVVEHAADLKVDEQGTVAAAATGIVGPTAIARPPGPTVTVDLDRPYLLLLRDDTSGAILFVARVEDPASS